MKILGEHEMTSVLKTQYASQRGNKTSNGFNYHVFQAGGLVEL